LQREAGVDVGGELRIGDVEAVVHARLCGCWMCGVEVLFEFAEPDSFLSLATLFLKA
jgi:hypothetical protein